MSIKTRTSGIIVDINVEPAGGGPFHANAVTFDGTNDWLSRGANLSGAADSKVGICSFWINPHNASSGATNIFVDSSGGVLFFKIEDVGGGQLLLQFSAGSSAIMLVRTASIDWFEGRGWSHVLLSWNVAAGTGTSQLYINNVSDIGTNTSADTAIPYTAATDWGFGAGSDGSSKSTADFAEFYFNTATSLDLSVAGNRAKFIDQTTLKPVYLGANGEVPTGTAPIVFFTNPTATWENNVGGGGGFTENGALTTAPTSPSD